MTVGIQMSSFCSFSPRCPKLKIDPVSRPPRPQLLASSIAPGIFPYLGGSIDAGQLRSVMTACEGAVVPGKKGAQLAAKTPGLLVDPAAYAPAGEGRFGAALRLRRMVNAPAG